MPTTYEMIHQLPDRYFDQPVQNAETGVLEQLERDYDENEVVITSPETGEEWDRHDANEFSRDLYHLVPEVVVNDPVAYIEAVLDGEDTPLGVIGDVSQETALAYARKQVTITT
jgi:hypothetical protein